MRVLLIDDDALVRLTLLDTLAAEGIEVDGLANAEDALVLLGAGQVPDVLVTDIDLGPGLSGLDLASLALERHPAVEVVLISGTSPAPGGHPPIGGALWPGRAGGQGGRGGGIEEWTPMAEVRDNPARSRFEMASGDAVAFVEYRREGGDRIVLTHTEVREALSGPGAGS